MDKVSESLTSKSSVKSQNSHAESFLRTKYTFFPLCFATMKSTETARDSQFPLLKSFQSFL